MPIRTMGSHRGSSLPSLSIGHSSSVGPRVAPKFPLDPVWRLPGRGREWRVKRELFVNASKLFRILSTRSDREELQKDLEVSDWPRK